MAKPVKVVVEKSATPEKETINNAKIIKII